MTPDTITINGQQLTDAEANTLRVAVTALHSEMSDPLALGEDEHGRTMTRLYSHHCEQILAMMGVISS